MTELAQDRLTVELEKTGETTDRIKSYRLSADYLTPADDFEFVVYSDDPVSLRRKFQPLQRVKLYIDGQLQLIGRIDGTEGVGDSSASLRVYGRDYIGEIVDGGADPSVRFKDGTQLGDAILDIVKPFGIETLVGSFNLTRNLLTGKSPFTGGPPRDFKASKLSDYKVGAGQGAYEAADKIAARHGYTIQNGGSRDTLAIVEPLFGQSPLYKLSKPGNVLRGVAKRDYGDIPTVTIVTGREGKPGGALKEILSEVPTFGKTAESGDQIVAFNEAARFPEVLRIVFGNTDAGEIPEVYMARVPWKGGVSPASAGLLYRPLYYEDKDARTEQQMRRGLRRELARRLKDMLVYHAIVRGHRDPDSGAIWSPDTVAEVYDEVEDVNENLWILDRTMSNDGSGPRTEMNLVRAGSIAL